MAAISTCDLCDAHAERARVIAPVFRSFGGRPAFHGPVSTARTFEDNSPVRDAVAEPGDGRVLIVDGGGSLARSLLGGDLAAKAAANGWAGVIVDGAVRDAAELSATNLGVLARALIPMKTIKRGIGERDVVIGLAGTVVAPGDYAYVDADGLVVFDAPVHV